MAQLQVSRLSPSHSADDVLKFLCEAIQGSVCGKLNSKTPDIYSSCKLPFSTQYSAQVNKTDNTIIEEAMRRRQIYVGRIQDEDISEQLIKDYLKEMIDNEEIEIKKLNT